MNRRRTFGIPDIQGGNADLPVFAAGDADLEDRLADKARAPVTSRDSRGRFGERAASHARLDVPAGACELLSGARPDPLPLELATLQRAGAATDAFVHAGRRAFATGREGRVHELRIHPLRVMHDAGVQDASPLDAVVTTLGVLRRYSLQGGVIAERIHIPASLPAAIFEWTSVSDGAPEALRFEWTIGPASGARTAAGEFEWRAEKNVLLVVDARSTARILFVGAADTFFDVQPNADGQDGRLHCVMHAQLRPDRPSRLLIAAELAGGEALDTVLDALRGPAAIVRARAGALRRDRREQLAVRTPDAELNTAWAWACHQLEAFLIEMPGSGAMPVTGYGEGTGIRDERAQHALGFTGADAFTTGLACLATGRLEAVRAVLTFFVSHQRSDGLIPSAGSTTGTVEFDAGAATALFLLLVARYYAWSGDRQLPVRHWLAIRRAVDACVLHAARDEADTGRLVAAALGELVGVAEALGDADAVQPLRRAGRAFDDSFVPTLGRGNDDPAATGWRSWAGYRDGQTASAFREWASVLRDVVRSGGAAGLANSAATSMAIVPFVFGMLGVVPNADRGRVRLRPQVPGDWDSLNVSGLCVGEARVSLLFRRDGRRHIFDVSQDSGAVPLRLVLEAAVPGTIVSVRVDDAAAELDIRHFGERQLAPVQLILDRTHRLELEVDT